MQAPEDGSDGAGTRGLNLGAANGAPDALADERLTVATEQTLTETDQTLSGSDQTSADSDQLASDQDQAASDHDLASGFDPRVHEASRGIPERTPRRLELSTSSRLVRGPDDQGVATDAGNA